MLFDNVFCQKTLLKRYHIRPLSFGHPTVGALGQEMVSIEGDVESLIRDMGASIQEADQFIKNF